MVSDPLIEDPKYLCLQGYKEKYYWDSPLVEWNSRYMLAWYGCRSVP